MNKHTPGPWVVRSQEALYSEGGIYEILNPFRHLPNQQLERPYTTQVQEANCDLIAAAPDLLEACKNVLDMLMPVSNDYELEMANELAYAIAKAEPDCEEK